MIRTKAEMYRRLAAGEFGNTIPQWLDVGAWQRDPAAAAFAVWGVRSQVPGGPCRLHCPTAEVRATAARFGCAVNISPMIDAAGATVTLMADVYDSPTGLIVYGVEYPLPGANWRQVMPRDGRQYDGLAARGVLARHLNPASLADLWALFERWPGHVVELSACARPFGTVPGRNAVIWEVRAY